MERPWVILCRVVHVATPGAHADAEEHTAVGEADEDAQAQQEERAAAVDVEAQAQHAAVGEVEEHVAAVDALAEAQEGHAAVGEAEEDPQAQLEESVVNVNTDAAASEAAHAAHGAAEPDFIISVAPPLEVSSLIAGLSSHPDPERPDMYPYIIACGRFCLLAHFAIEPSYGTNFREDPNHSHLVVVRHFRRAGGQIAACAVRVPDRPKNILKLTNVDSVGLVCNNQTGHYKIAELAIPSGCPSFFIRFSSDLGVWQSYRLPSPLDADDDRREWVPHGTVAINSTVLWFDLSWGIISCDLAQTPGLPMLDFHRLPLGRLLRGGATPDIHSRRCITVSENLVRYVEIILSPHPNVSMWYQDSEHNPWQWIANYEERFEDIWKNDSYIKTGLPRNPPMLVGVCPVNSNVVYFTLNQRLFSVNVPDHTVVNCQGYEPLNKPGPVDEPITSRYLIAWSLDADGAINVGHQPDEHSDQNPLPSLPSLRDTSSLPQQGTPAPWPSSSPLRGHATIPLPSVSASASAGKETPSFDIFLDDFANSLGKALDGIRGFFNSILNNDLAQGKLVTKTWGCFMIRIFSSTNSIDNPVYALYRTHDLYLDSVFSDKRWYRFEDYQANLPLEVESEGSVILKFGSSYTSLDCDPNLDKCEILVGFSKVMEHSQTLQKLASTCISSIGEVKKAFVFLILFMEALRFPDFERWLLIWVSSKECKSVPTVHTKRFREWGNLSIVFHAGRNEFSKARESVKKLCQTYDDVGPLLGIVNRVNMRKQTKATKGKKKKNTRWDAEEADSSFDNKRGKKRR